ncbi:hypothetical protein GCM10009789_54180 [Kribbella sancticallisti]|uniref:Uncharacterized protein n=1 Tax=Kribbella sancticallisti TaxID=460087 RepID=A0ABN2E4Q9_9ACTN
MNGWEFAAELITKAYWPIIVGLLLLTQRKPITRLVDRVRRGTGPGGVAFEADPSALLAEAVADAVQPAQLPTEDDSAGSGEARQQAVMQRRRDIEEVAKRAAEWGQYIARHYPPEERGQYWEPALEWMSDGSVEIPGGRRAQAEHWAPLGPVEFPPAPPEASLWYFRTKRAEKEAEGNDSRPS